MIARLLAGAARALFQIGILLGLAAALAFYGAWRLLKAATVGAPTPPRQAALWQLLGALVVAGRAFAPELELDAGDELADEVAELRGRVEHAVDRLEDDEEFWPSVVV